MTSQMYFHLNSTFSGFIVPVILNRCILPAILHNFIGTQYCPLEINSIIFTALEKKHPLLSFRILYCRTAKITRPKIVLVNAKII